MDFESILNSKSRDSYQPYYAISWFVDERQNKVKFARFTPKMASDIDERMRKVLSHLDPNLPSANIYPALVAIRTK